MNVIQRYVVTKNLGCTKWMCPRLFAALWMTLHFVFLPVSLQAQELSLAVKLQQIMEAKYPTLARPLMLMSKKYNQSLSTGSLLIEFGTDVNTLSEACYSAEMVGDSLVSLLNTLK